MADNVNKIIARIRAENPIHPEPEKTPEPRELLKRITDRINRSFDQIRRKNTYVKEPVKALPILWKSGFVKKEIPLKPENRNLADGRLNDMEADLKKRFFRQLLDDLLNDNIKLFPTMIVEMERPEIMESIRKSILFSADTKPFTSRIIRPQQRECLGKNKRIKDYGNLYILVNIN